MFAFLKRGDKGRPAPERRSARLGLEGLETRQLLSGVGVGSIVPAPAAAFQVPAAQVQTTSPSPVNAMSSQVANVTRMFNDEVHTVSLMFSNFTVNLQREFEYVRELGYKWLHSVPSLAGINFAMTSKVDGHNHSLLIKTQTDALFGDTATITGEWDAPAPVTAGTLVGNPDGSISIQFSWGGRNNGALHTFSGTITGQPGAYQISGHVTVYDSNGNPTTLGPGDCVGKQV
jgi:hypothetical protein